MKLKNLKILIVLALMLLITACEQVPPVHRGKILKPGGYNAEILKPGRYWPGFRGEIILIETATNTMSEPMKVIMSDKLTLTFNVNFSAYIDGSDEVLNSLFEKIVPDNNRVTLRKVYEIYGKMVVKNKAREVLGVYSVEDVHKNYGKISAQLAEAILPELELTPLKMNNVTLGNIKYPDLITESVERAAEKKQEIEQEKAKAEIAMTKKDNELRLAEADYKIKITKAKAIRDENKLLSEGITDDLIKIKRLDLLESIIENNNEGNIIYMPVEALTSQGAQMMMYNKTPK